MTVSQLQETVSELKEQMAGPRQEAWLRYRQLLRHGGDTEDDAEDLASVAVELGIGAEIIEAHRKAIILHAEQVERKERFTLQVKRFARLAVRIQERSEEIREQTRAAQTEIEDLVKRRMDLSSTGASLSQATLEVDAMEVAFPALFADEPADDPDLSTLRPEVRGVLHNKKISPPDPPNATQQAQERDQQAVRRHRDADQEQIANRRKRVEEEKKKEEEAIS